MNNPDIESGNILQVPQLTQDDGQSSRERAKETTVSGDAVQTPRILRLWKRIRHNLSQPDIPRQCPGGVAQPDHQDEATNAPVRQIPSKYTSSVFNKLPTPMPVCNVIRGVRLVIITRFIVKSAVFYLIYGSLLNINIIFLFMGAILLKIVSMVFSDLKMVQRIWKAFKRSATVGFTNVLSIFLKHIAARALLKSQNPKLIASWWAAYMICSVGDEFEIDYMEAWREQERSKNPNYTELTIFLGEETISIPTSTETDPPVDDKVLLSHLMTFFQLLRLRRGIRELMVPKRLCKVDCVEVERRSGGDTSGDYIESLKLGRGLRDFFDPQAGHSTVSSQLKEVRSKYHTSGLEFVRELDRAAFGGIIIIPSAASLIFAIAWMTSFLVRGKDPQATVSAAFTVAAYLVTAGSLIIALVAYFDTKVEDEDPRAMFKEILSQRRGRENAQPPIIVDITSDQLQPVLEELRNIVAKLPTVDERNRDINGICAEIKSGFVAQSAAMAEQKTAIDSLNESIKNVAEQQNELLTSLHTAVDDSLLSQSIINLNSKMGQVLSIQSDTAGLLQKYLLAKPIQPGEDANDPPPLETSL